METGMRYVLLEILNNMQGSVLKPPELQKKLGIFNILNKQKKVYKIV
jgi:hypothetical protein